MPSIGWHCHPNIPRVGDRGGAFSRVLGVTFTLILCKSCGAFCGVTCDLCRVVLILAMMLRQIDACIGGASTHCPDKADAF